MKKHTKKTKHLVFHFKREHKAFYENTTHARKDERTNARTHAHTHTHTHTHTHIKQMSNNTNIGYRYIKKM